MSNNNIIDDQDLTDVIPNPNRGKQRQVLQQEEPNYIRLNKPPIQMPSRSVPAPRKIVEQAILPETVSTVNSSVVNENDETSNTNLGVGGWIDNNDFVFPPDKILPQDAIKHRGETFNQNTPLPSATDPSSFSAPILGQPRVGEYILMVLGKIVDTGSLSSIEGTVRAILYGENEGFVGQDVRETDIVVLKRVPIQVGIFVDRG